MQKHRIYGTDHRDKTDDKWTRITSVTPTPDARQLPFLSLMRRSADDELYFVFFSLS